ncbi:MAG: hypothetical protein K6T68_10570, partial [Alicyclobacillus shizuokensis]|nr:hypothetical protein [Alicyclobacillus shizuokensis]
MTQATLPEAANSLQSKDEVFDLLLKPEVQQSLATLVENLPRIAGMVAVLNKVCDLAKEVLTDAEFMGAVDEMIREKTKPIQAKLGDLPSAIREAKQRAEASNACRAERTRGRRRRSSPSNSVASSSVKRRSGSGAPDDPCSSVPPILPAHASRSAGSSRRSVTLSPAWSGKRPRRSISTARMPSAAAGSTSSAGLSPTNA